VTVLGDYFNLLSFTILPQPREMLQNGDVSSYSKMCPHSVTFLGMLCMDLVTFTFNIPLEPTASQGTVRLDSRLSENKGCLSPVIWTIAKKQKGSVILHGRIQCLF